MNDIHLIIRVLEDDIEDLATWSAYNDDKYLEAVEILRKTIELIKEKENMI